VHVQRSLVLCWTKLKTDMKLSFFLVRSSVSRCEHEISVEKRGTVADRYLMELLFPDIVHAVRETVNYIRSVRNS
jgi:hypothetical protein